MIGTVKSSEIKKNLDGETDVLVLKVEISEADDVQDAEVYPESGVDYRPMAGDHVFLAEGEAGSNLLVIASQDVMVPDVDEGERRSYSRDESGEKAAQVYYKKDGKLQLNDGEDLAVAHGRLKIEFNKLQSTVDALVQAHNSHIHVTTATVGTGSPGVISPTTAQAQASDSDIDNAVSDTVEIP